MGGGSGRRTDVYRMREEEEEKEEQEEGKEREKEGQNPIEKREEIMEEEFEKE